MDSSSFSRIWADPFRVGELPDGRQHQGILRIIVDILKGIRNKLDDRIEKIHQFLPQGGVVLGFLNGLNPENNQRHHAGGRQQQHQQAQRRREPVPSPAGGPAWCTGRMPG